MMDKVNQQISACLDGELSSGETQLLLKRLGRDGQYRDTLSRYVLLGEVMRNGVAPELLDGRFADILASRVSDEAQGAKSVSSWAGKFRRTVLGSGVAAAVALLAIASLQHVMLDDGQVDLGADNAAAPISYTVPEPPDQMGSYMVGSGSQAVIARNSSWARVVAAGFVKEVEVMEPVDIQEDVDEGLVVDPAPRENQP
ncbi:MAG: sigma-E factor negative regulatory protein [Gammaproteobacteria bacterium]|nr:sigma-E factor negative regulatory protein [Gammaproteobacteria bacterium]